MEAKAKQPMPQPKKLPGPKKMGPKKIVGGDFAAKLGGKNLIFFSYENSSFSKKTTQVCLLVGDLEGLLQ